jgi:hypothetical protein
VACKKINSPGRVDSVDAERADCDDLVANRQRQVDTAAQQIAPGALSPC